jgi:hypothetical protein
MNAPQLNIPSFRALVMPCVSLESRDFVENFIISTNVASPIISAPPLAQQGTASRD